MKNGTTNVDQSAKLNVISYTMSVNEKGEINHTTEVDYGKDLYSIDETELAAEFDRDGAITITLEESKTKTKKKVNKKEIIKEDEEPSK